MKVIENKIQGLILLEPDIFEDERGYFFESYNKERFKAFGIDIDFVQDNHSFSQKNTLRGLHFQKSHTQAKLIRVVRGEVWDVAVDLRKSSPTFGRYMACPLSEENKRMFYIPGGFAHGFVVMSKTALVLYKVSTYYNSKLERGIAWNDKDLAIDWPVSDPILSDRDKSNPSIEEYFKSI